MEINFSQELLELSLYYSKKLTEKEKIELIDLLKEQYSDKKLITIDSYCIHCKKNSTFKLNKEYQFDSVLSNSFLTTTDIPIPITEIKGKYFTLNFVCSRNYNHNIIMIFKYKEDTNEIIKIGQYPSRADIEKYHLKEYQKVLPKEKFNELVKAIGLNSHGIGIGSFVYLRRIIEYLIEEAYQKAKTKKDVDEEKYKNSNAIKKIKILSDYLPKFMVENKEIYAILSKGIHELSEQDCLKYFSPLKTTIEMILDEKLKEREKKKKLSKLHKEINTIHSDIKKTKS